MLHAYINPDKTHIEKNRPNVVFISTSNILVFEQCYYSLFTLFKWHWPIILNVDVGVLIGPFVGIGVVLLLTSGVVCIVFIVNR